MTTEQSRVLAMLQKVRAFRVKHGAVFAPDSNAAKRFAKNQAFIAQLDAQADDQRGGTSGGHGATTLKTGQVAALRARVKAIVETGQTVFAPGPDNPNANADLEKQMRVPHRGKISALLTDARDLKEAVTPHQAAFVAEEMPADFLATLQSAIDAIGEAEGDQDENDLEHIGATTNLEKLAREAIQNVRDLDRPVSNRFADDAGILSEWDSASHIQVGLVGRQNEATAPA